MPKSKKPLGIAIPTNELNDAVDLKFSTTFDIGKLIQIAGRRYQELPPDVQKKAQAIAIGQIMPGVQALLAILDPTGAMNFGVELGAGVAASGVARGIAGPPRKGRKIHNAMKVIRADFGPYRKNPKEGA